MMFCTHTKLLDLSKEEALEFTLPAPGDYPFVCSFPGHGIIMRGVLKAKWAPHESGVPEMLKAGLKSRS